MLYYHINLKIEFNYFFLFLVYNHSIWRHEYTFSKQYFNNLNTKSVLNVVHNLIAIKNSTWTSYISHMKTLYESISGHNIFKEYCAARHISELAYNECVKYYENKGL